MEEFWAYVRLKQEALASNATITAVNRIAGKTILSFDAGATLTPTPSLNGRTLKMPFLNELVDLLVSRRTAATGKATKFGNVSWPRGS